MLFKNETYFPSAKACSVPVGLQNFRMQSQTQNSEIRNFARTLFTQRMKLMLRSRGKKPIVLTPKDLTVEKIWSAVWCITMLWYVWLSVYDFVSLWFTR